MSWGSPLVCRSRPAPSLNRERRTGNGQPVSPLASASGLDDPRGVMAAESCVLRVGLTGGVASGKSALARLLAARGAAVRDADEVVASLYAAGAPGALAVADLFGADLLAADGSVDRGRLGALVLADSGRRRHLEEAVHPFVRGEIARWFAARPPATVAVLEAALLVETGSFRDYHRLIVVTAPLELRRRRALASGWPSEQFERTLAAQADDAARVAVADYVVVNDLDEDALEGKAGRLWTWLVGDARALGDGRPLPPRLHAGGPTRC